MTDEFVFVSLIVCVLAMGAALCSIAFTIRDYRRRRALEKRLDESAWREAGGRRGERVEQ
jgi:hypothetical protein